MNTSEILTGLTVISFSLQLCYFFCVYMKILYHKSKSFQGKNIKAVSVIISAKDEADNLKKFLPVILNQNYSEFELIVVNDRSKDGTGKVLNDFQKKYSRLKVINIPEKETNAGGKKNALTKAINAAENDYLLFTDADCYPVSKNWIKSIIGSYNSETEIVIGFGAYEVQKGFLNKLIRFETVFNAMQYMSFALRGYPYMAVGRNLSYKKSVFIKNEGFKKHLNILSGDDDLFINEVARSDNTNVICNPESKTVSIPKKTFKEYFIQKRRHLMTGKKYKFRAKLFLGTEIISRFIFYLSIMLSVVYDYYVLALSVYLIRMLILIFFIKFYSEKLNEKKNIFFIPIFDILIPIINLFIYSGIFFDKNIRWK